MVYLSLERIRTLNTDPHNIRNFSIISLAHPSNSYLELLHDFLCVHAGVIVIAVPPYNHRWSDDWDRALLKRQANALLYYESYFPDPGHKSEYLINMIELCLCNSLSSEITSTLRVVDGVLAIVDLDIAEPDGQIGSMLRQAMSEKVRPVLMIDGIEKNMLDPKQDGEMIYQAIVKLLMTMDAITSSFGQVDIGNISLWPIHGNVVIGSTSQGWGFTLKTFAMLYSKKLGIDVNTLIGKLWGDNYFDPETKCWLTQNTTASGEILQRGFVQLILQPIIKMIRCIIEGNEQQIDQILATIDIKVSPEERQLKDAKLLKCIMSKWLNLADCVLEMIAVHLPSPKEAQIYRTSYLYDGPQDDPCAQAMRDCDPKGPLMIYISRIIPTVGTSTYAFGRVFSGTVSAGQKVRILGSGYIPGRKEDLAVQNISKIILPVGRYPAENCSEISAGSLVYLSGVARYIIKKGTITDCEDACPIRTPKYSVSPVVKVAVQPKEVSNLPKLFEGLKKLAQLDERAQVETLDTGDMLITGVSDQHLELCLKAVEEDYAGCEIIKSEIMVSYKETIAATSRLCLAKSANKHNRIYCVGEPISRELAHAIETKQVSVNDNQQVLANKLRNEFDWEIENPKQIWAFGSDSSIPNVLVNMTQGVQYINEIKDSCQAAFCWATREGVLCQENMRQFRANIVDVSLHSDAIHRGGGQMIPAVRRVLSACQLTAQPRLQEPVYLAEITAPLSALEGVRKCLGEKREIAIEELEINGSHLWLIKSYLPVTESFGFPAYLRDQTNGCAFCHLVFSHWMQMDDDPLDGVSRSYKIAEDIRRRKGMRTEPPDLALYMDNL